MTYQDYFKQADFEDIWKYLQSIFCEDEKLKPLYKDLIETLKKLPVKKEYCNESINFFWSPYLYVGGAPDPQEWLVGREVKRNFPRRVGVRNKLEDPAEIAAYLIYWSTLYSFKTQRQYFKEYEKRLESRKSGKLFKINYDERAVAESNRRKRELFWKSTLHYDYAFSWSSNLWILMKKLQYNIGYWKFFQFHIGWEEEVKRMTTCYNLLKLSASKDGLSRVDKSLYINGNNASRYGIKIEAGDLKNLSLEKLRKEKAYSIVWKYIDHNMKEWWD